VVVGFFFGGYFLSGYEEEVGLDISCHKLFGLLFIMQAFPCCQCYFPSFRPYFPFPFPDDCVPTHFLHTLATRTRFIILGCSLLLHCLFNGIRAAMGMMWIFPPGSGDLDQAAALGLALFSVRRIHFGQAYK
jgi:hypothetical protein